MPLTSEQLAEVIADCEDYMSFARCWHLLGDRERALRCAALARHARRRLRAHVRELRKQLRDVLARSEHNVIGRMLAEQLLKGEMSRQEHQR